MKVKFSTRLLSILLSAVIFLSVFAPVAFAVSDGDVSPVIYVIGRTLLYNDDGQNIPFSDSDKISAAVKEAIPYAAKALTLGGKYWDTYSDATYDLVMQFFDGYGLDENGNIQSDVKSRWTWSESELSTDYKSDDPYTYRFEYDSRLSPMEVAMT